ncbi:MAG: hypothetical protein ACD_58C00206G0003 [uncultured bacterium]|nr:MAG: hypothetical protein ACD_58C00206G0003 [uncultured bacterium]
MKKNDWFVTKRGSVPTNVFETGVVGISKYYKQFFGLKFGKLLFYFDDNMIYWCWDVDTMQKFTKKYVKEIKLRTQSNFKNNWTKLAFDLNKISMRVINADVSVLTNLEKFKLYKELSKYSEKFHAYSASSIDFLDMFLQEFVEKEFKKIPARFQNPENFEILMSQNELSVVIQKEIDLLRVKIGELNIDDFYNKYFWINCGWLKQSIYSQIEIKEDLDKIKLSSDKIRQKIKDTLDNIKKSQLQKTKLLQKINSRSLSNLIDFVDQMVYYHDDRKRYQMISVIAINRILKNIEEYNFNDILWCKGSEISDYLRDNKPIDIVKIRKRQKGGLMIADNDKVTYLFNSKTKEKTEKIIFNNKIDQTVRELKGSVAYPGFVKGRVKIILDSHGMHDKITKDDILVTGMTTPDFVPIMKKVGAIVTDEGGLTCHAAIISRELGIPCIIGTKIATKVLKDGDLVEVDAEHGIIKILEKNG